MRFDPVGNTGSRTWWGTGRLSDRNLGVWRGDWLMGVNGPREGKYDLRFLKWCENHGHSCIRTVDLFWAFEYHQRGFPRKCSTKVLYRKWEAGKKERRKLLCGEWTLFAVPGERNPSIWQLVHGRCKVSSLAGARRLRGKKLLDFVDNFYPHYGPWRRFYRREKAYFLDQLAQYNQVVKFWRHSGDLVRKSFLRCARYSNRRPEAHPDYLVVFRDRRGRRVDFGFVEVKGPRESVRTSQKRFFPELVMCAGQSVLVARFTMRGTEIKFARFTAQGKLFSVRPVPGSV